MKKNSPISIRPLQKDDSQPIYDMILRQGHDLDAFSWRARVTSPKAELEFIEWSIQAEQRQEAFTRVILIDTILAGCVSLYRPHQESFKHPDLLQPITFQLGYWVDKHHRGIGASWKAMLLLMNEISQSYDSSTLVGIRTRTKNFASQSCGRNLGLSITATQLPSLFDPHDTDVIMTGPLQPIEPILLKQNTFNTLK